MTEKVISFPGAEPLPENLIQIKDDPLRYTRHCRHDRISLDEHQRVVSCLDCSAVLDPFEFLSNNARTLQRAWSNYAAATRKVQELTDRIAALAKEQKSLQGKVSRLREKVPTVEVRGKDRL